MTTAGRYPSSDQERQERCGHGTVEEAEAEVRREWKTSVGHKERQRNRKEGRRSGIVEDVKQRVIKGRQASRRKVRKAKEMKGKE